MLLQGQVVHLREDALVRQAGEVAGVEELVRAPLVRELEHVARVVLGRPGRRRVVQVGPLEQQLDAQVGPRIAAVTHDDAEFREEPGDFVEQAGVLALVGHARTGHADQHVDRDVELDALGVDGVEALVVDRRLRVCKARRGGGGADVGMEFDRRLERPDAVHAGIRIDADGAEEAAGKLLEQLQRRRRVLGADADLGDLDAERVHHRDDLGGFHLTVHPLPGVLEQVLGRVVGELLRAAVTAEPAHRLHAHPGAAGRDLKHQIDDADVLGSAHVRPQWFERAVPATCAGAELRLPVRRPCASRRVPTSGRPRSGRRRPSRPSPP